MENKETPVMLSEHFSLYELTRSGTAQRLGMKNLPDDEQIENLRQLCRHVLEPLRRRFGRIIVTSGFRCEELNRKVGGVAHSQHLTGQAADIHLSNKEMGRRYFDFIAAHVAFDQLLLERRISNGCAWLHVSYCRPETGRENRHDAQTMTLK